LSDILFQLEKTSSLPEGYENSEQSAEEESFKKPKSPAENRKGGGRWSTQRRNKGKMVRDKITTSKQFRAIPA